jgi:predicted nuclease of predicted toxin-antitoxin system
MKFLLDDNIPYSVKKWFQEKGFEVVKLFEIGLKGADDETIYRYAIENGFTVITLDLDFGYLFLKFQKGTIIVLRPHRSVPNEIICLLERSIKVILEKEGLIVVKPTKIRVIKP